MTPRLRLPFALAGVLLAFLVPVAPAAADAFEDVARDFVDDGVVDPCEHTSEDLRTALEQITADIDQYVPEVEAAIRRALQERARGACDRDREGNPTDGGGGSPVPVPGGTLPPPSAPLPDTPVPAPSSGGGGPDPVLRETLDAPPAPPAVPRATDDGRPVAPLPVDLADSRAPLPAPVVLLLLVVLGLAVWLGGRALARRVAWRPAWAGDFAHAVAEAGLRTRLTLAELGDWLRLGR